MKFQTIQKSEIEASFGKLLGSQREFIFAPEAFTVIAGGFASGKTHVSILKGLILSAVFPRNVGMIARFRSTDLDDTTKPLFFELCPPSWIKSYNKKSNIVTLRNGSQIYFRHIHDASAKKKDEATAIGPKTRRLGSNLGWFFIDQMEEIELEHWNAMTSRLRLKTAPARFGFGAVNPKGHDWIWKMFFRTFRPWIRGEEGRPVEFYQIIRDKSNPDVLGVAVNSNENRVSNGGFVDDDYFDKNMRSWPAEWIERYIYCSFDDFTGKIFKEYEAGIEDDELASVHNIDPFPIPKHWDLVVPIDVGGDSPWAVTPMYVDDDGNLIVTDGFHKRTGLVRQVSAWIKENLPWNETRTTYVIDWENKVAMVELGEHGIFARPANKAVKPGILRTVGYFHVNPARDLPSWYEDTQPLEKIRKFKGKGAPRIFVFRTALTIREEWDTYIWNPNKLDEPYKTSTKRWDTCDSIRYGIMERPEASKMPDKEDKFASLAKKDPLSYREWSKLDKRIAERQARQRGAMALREADTDEVVEFDTSRDKNEWTGKEEW